MRFLTGKKDSKPLPNSYIIILITKSTIKLRVLSCSFKMMLKVL